MKEIVVLSGKGGVGKSSLTASIGEILAERYAILLADTDVDAPNLHLLLDARLAGSEEVTASEKAYINYDECAGCMACMESCKFSAIIGDDEPIIAFYACEGCGACAITCPEKAMVIRKVANGRVNTFSVGKVSMVAGELYIGESSSGRLVDLVKRTARRKAEESKSDLILTDGPPGIGCPVIASIKGCTYVLIVTEPTPAALHDMARLLEVTAFFRVPVGIVLNKAGMAPALETTIKQFAADRALPVLAEIPYDNAMSMAISIARPVVAAYPDSPSARALRDLAGHLSHVIEEM